MRAAAQSTGIPAFFFQMQYVAYHRDFPRHRHKSHNRTHGRLIPHTQAASWNTPVEGYPPLPIGTSLPVGGFFAARGVTEHRFYWRNMFFAHGLCLRHNETK